MTTNFTETGVGTAGEEYLCERLADGNSLAQAVRQQLVFSEGSIKTLLPAGISLLDVRDFKLGGKLPTAPQSEWRGITKNDETLLMIPTPNTDGWLVKEIRETLPSIKSGVCVFEDALKHPGDPVVGKLRTRFGVFGKEVYHLIFSSDAVGDAVSRTISAAKSIPQFVGFITEWPDPIPNGGNVTMTASQIQHLSDHVHKVIVGAFDGESYLIWTRQR